MDSTLVPMLLVSVLLAVVFLFGLSIVAIGAFFIMRETNRIPDIMNRLIMMENNIKTVILNQQTDRMASAVDGFPSGMQRMFIAGKHADVDPMKLLEKLRNDPDTTPEDIQIVEKFIDDFNANNNIDFDDEEDDS